MKITDPIKRKCEIIGIKKYYYERGEYRNALLISFGINAGLRIADILSVKAEDVYDFEKRGLRKYIIIKEKKTGKNARIRINKALAADLKVYFKKYGKNKGQLLFKSRKGGNAISRVQAYRIIKAAANACGIEGKIGCHSLRKTFGYMAWKSGAEPVLLMKLFNHSSFEVTKRYLGIEQEEKDEIYMRVGSF